MDSEHEDGCGLQYAFEEGEGDWEVAEADVSPFAVSADFV